MMRWLRVIAAAVVMAVAFVPASSFAGQPTDVVLVAEQAPLGQRQASAAAERVLRHAPRPSRDAAAPRALVAKAPAQTCEARAPRTKLYLSNCTLLC